MAVAAAVVVVQEIDLEAVRGYSPTRLQSCHKKVAFAPKTTKQKSEGLSVFG